MVYNFTVEDNHTYFVGKNSILVHNTCKMFKSARDEAGKTAKAKALDDIINGRKYKKWGLDPSNLYDLKVVEYVQTNRTFIGSGCEFAHSVVLS